MTVAPRAIFVALLLLVLATQACRLAGDAVAEPASDLASRMAAIGLRAVATDADGVVLAQAAGCGGRVALAELAFDGEGATAGRALLARGGATRAVYLGEAAPSLGATSLLARWAAASVWRSLGLRRAAVPRHYFLVSLPPDCPELAARNWPALSPWNP